MKGMLSSLVALVVLCSGHPQSRAEDAPPLGKEAGPYLVAARTFRGPDAEKLAQTLATELRTRQGMTAYLYRNPKNSAYLSVAVLVGDAKTPEEQAALL